VKLLRKVANDPLLPAYHPKIVGLEGELKNFRDKIGEILRGEISVELKSAVQTDKSTIKRSAVEGDDGDKLLLIELSLIADNYDESAAAELVSFTH
jgi:hypothetical protein